MPATSLCCRRAGPRLLLADGWVALACLVCGCLPLPASAQAADQAAPSAAAPARFDILEFVVEGNTVLASEVIERAVYPFMGEQRSLDDVEQARSALEKAYRDAGYGTVGVDIPEQRVVGGVVTLQVVQGAVSRLRVTGSRYYSQDRIIAAVPALAEGAVPNLKQVQEQMVGVNRGADRRVTPLLRPGKEPGTTEVDLAVEDQLPLHGSLELNNRQSPNTSSTRLVASLRYDNLWQREHSLALQVQTSPEDAQEVRVFSAGYTLPLGADSLAFSLVRSDSNVAAGVGDTTVFGKGTIYGLRRTFMLTVQDKRFDAMTLGVDYKDFNETIEVGSGQGITTPIRLLPFTAGYVAGRDDERGRWQFGGSLTVALRGLASRESQFADKRFGAQSNFSVLKLDVAREHKLPMGLRLSARSEVQLSNQPLISNEQFVAGGVDSVRGYPESVAVGDQAIRAGLELRSGELAGAGWPGIGSLSVHGFAEGAALELRKPLPQQDYRFGLLGAGFGLRVKFKPLGSLSLHLAWALHPVGSVQRGDFRLHGAGLIEF